MDENTPPTEPRPTYTPDGHHVVPKQVQEQNNFSDPVKAELNENRLKGYDSETGDQVNHGASGHTEYNKRVNKETKEYIEEWKNQGGADPSGLSDQEAKKFADGLRNRILNSQDSYVKGFNEQIAAGRTQDEIKVWSRAMLDAEANASKMGRVLSAAGTTAKWVTKAGGKVCLVLTVATVTADLAQAGPEVAAKNFVKSVTLYDVTVEPIGKWTNEVYDQAQKGQMNNDNPIGHAKNEQIDSINLLNSTLNQ